MGQGRFSISADALYSRLGTAGAPLIIDVRREPAFDADDRMIIGAIRSPPDEIAARQCDGPHARTVVAYCLHGHEVSQGAAETLRRLGADARYLEGGIGAWVEQNLPTRRKTGPAPRQWVTREHPKIEALPVPG